MLHSSSRTNFSTATPLINNHRTWNTSARSEEHPKCESQSNPDRDTYENIYNHITERYAAFDPGTEKGFNNSPGITSDIQNITVKDLISMLTHIKNNESLLTMCLEDSARSPLFDKLSLASNKEQGWNLRLHRFKLEGSGLGGEDSPHFHRWTLASKIISGGYMNINYEEGKVDDARLEKDGYEKLEYSKYHLPATKNQSSSKQREVTLLDKKVVMTRCKQEIFARGDLCHFPIKDPHSIDTASGYMGTTTTLAHTGKPQIPTSIVYEKKPTLEFLPQIKYESTENIKKAIDNQKALLQVIALADDLHELLGRRLNDHTGLTGGELGHWHDYGEFNYIETSLLPAISIYVMEKENGIDSHQDFSKETSDFLEEKLSEIDKNELTGIINNNQFDLSRGRLTIHEDRDGNPEFFKAMDGRRTSQPPRV
jgi:hypothetical protein